MVPAQRNSPRNLQIIPLVKLIFIVNFLELEPLASFQFLPCQVAYNLISLHVNSASFTQVFLLFDFTGVFISLLTIIPTFVYIWISCAFYFYPFILVWRSNLTNSACLSRTTLGLVPLLCSALLYVCSVLQRDENSKIHSWFFLGIVINKGKERHCNMQLDFHFTLIWFPRRAAHTTMSMCHWLPHVPCVAYVETS